MYKSDLDRKRARLESSRKYYSSHKKEHSQRVKNWRNKHKKAWLENSRRYSQEKRELLRLTIAGKCQVCLKEKYLCIHHKNRNHFDNRKSNLMILCRACHAKEHLKDRIRLSDGRLQ